MKQRPIRDAYGYNARSEVTSARRTLASDPNQEVRGFSYDYAYDPIGNRTSATEYDHGDNALVESYTANALNQYSQRTVPGYADVRGSATNTATVTVNGNTAWRLGEYFYGGDAADNAASAVMKELAPPDAGVVPVRLAQGRNTTLLGLARASAAPHSRRDEAGIPAGASKQRRGQPRNFLRHHRVKERA